MEGHLEDAEQQLEFLTEIQQSIGKSGVREHLYHILTYFKNQHELSNNVAHGMASRFSFYSFPGYEFLISTITFLISRI